MIQADFLFKNLEYLIAKIGSNPNEFPLENSIKLCSNPEKNFQENHFNFCKIFTQIFLKN